MAPPKPPVKSSNVPPTESVFAAMKKQSALAKNMAKAKKVVAVREFDGPDGDYTSNLSRLSHYTKDGSLGAVLEFRCIDEGEYSGQKMVIFYSFKTTDRETVQEVQNRFFETIQLLGVSTDVEDDSELDKAISSIISSKDAITLRVKSGKKPGSKFINVVGVANAAEEIEETEYVEEGTEEVEEVATEVEEVDEWVEETTEEDTTEEEEEVEDTNLPSAWVGYAMIYKGKEVEVLSANDPEMKCTVKDGAKKIIVPFSALSPPAN